MNLFKKKRRKGTLSDGTVTSIAPPEPTTGIFVQWVKHEEAGEVVAVHCHICKTTYFTLSPWAKSDDKYEGVWMYWKLEVPCIHHLWTPKIEVEAPQLKIEEEVAMYIMHKYSHLFCSPIPEKK